MPQNSHCVLSTASHSDGLCAEGMQTTPPEIGQQFNRKGSKDSNGKAQSSMSRLKSSMSALSNSLSLSTPEKEKVEREIGALKEIKENSVRWYIPVESTKSWHQFVRGCAHALVEKPVVQAFVSFMILMDLTLTTTSFVISEKASSHIGFYVANFIIIMVLTAEVILRLLSDGLAFFKKPIDIIEVFVVITCLVCFFLESGPQGASLGRTLRPLFRAMKGIRLASKVALSKNRIAVKMNKLIDMTVHQIVESYIGGLIYLPRDHLTVKATAGVLYVEKAHIISSAFDGFHLPFNIKGGLLELARIDLGLEKKSYELPGVEITLHNLLVVIGPGHQKWDYEAVATAKERLVAAITHKLEAKMRNTGTKDLDVLDEDGVQVEQMEKKGLMAACVNRITKGLKAALFARVSVKVKNVAIRYEDNCQLQGQGVLGVFKVGQMSMTLLSDSPQLQHLQEPNLRVNSKWKCFSGSESENEKQNLVVEGKAKAASMFGKMDISRVSAWWGVNVDAGKLHFGPDLAVAESVHNVAHRFRVEDLKERVQVACMERYSSPFGAWRRAWSYGFFLHPSCASVHMALACPSENDRQEEKTSSTCPPAHDIDILVKIINVSILRKHLWSLIHLAKYLDQWQRDDERIQWRPRWSPGHFRDLRVWRGSSLWWPYSLWCLQRQVDSSLPWKCLPLLSQKRKFVLRREYRETFLHKLGWMAWNEGKKKAERRRIRCVGADAGSQDDTPEHQGWTLRHEERLMELTVALPFKDLLRARKEAYAEHWRKVKEASGCPGQPTSDQLAALSEQLEYELEEDLGIDIDGDDKAGNANQSYEDSKELDLESGENTQPDARTSPGKRNSQSLFRIHGNPSQTQVRALQVNMNVDYISLTFKRVAQDCNDIWASKEVARINMRGANALLCKEASARVQMMMQPVLWDTSQADECGLTVAQQASIEEFLELNPHASAETISRILAPFGVSKSAVVKFLQTRVATSSTGWMGFHATLDTIQGVDCTAPSSAIFGRQFLTNASKSHEPLFAMKIRRSPHEGFLDDHDTLWSSHINLQPIKAVIYQPLVLALTEIASEMHVPDERECDWPEIKRMRKRFEKRFEFQKSQQIGHKLFEALSGPQRQKWNIVLSNGAIEGSYLVPLAMGRWVVHKASIPSGRQEYSRYGFSWPPPFFAGGLVLQEENDAETLDSQQEELPTCVPASRRQASPNRKLDHQSYFCSKVPMCPMVYPACADRVAVERSCCSRFEQKREVIDVKDEMSFEDSAFESSCGSDPLLMQDPFDVDPLKMEDQFEDGARPFWSPEQLSDFRWSSLPIQISVEAMSAKALGLPEPSFIDCYGKLGSSAPAPTSASTSTPASTTASNSKSNSSSSLSF